MTLYYSSKWYDVMIMKFINETHAILSIVAVSNRGNIKHNHAFYHASLPSCVRMADLCNVLYWRQTIA